jgi:hypothetical protein
MGNVPIKFKKGFSIMEKSIFEQMGGTYREEDGYLIPNLSLPEREEHTIGKYGQQHLDFLKKHRRGTYTTLLTEYRLNEYLHEIDLQATEMVERLISELAEKQGVSDALKAQSQMQWVMAMNNIKLTAEEIVRHDLLCPVG